jgi:hypothetical protein
MLFSGALLTYSPTDDVMVIVHCISNTSECSLTSLVAKWAEQWRASFPQELDDEQFEEHMKYLRVRYAMEFGITETNSNSSGSTDRLLWRRISI